jgi:enamine deaminase RidA (YjgF/YER057c/UK114 family)
MPHIQRYESNARLSRIVVYNGVVYLSGITSEVTDGDITVQTESVLNTIDARLASVGSCKEKILSAQIWLKDIDQDFPKLNLAWEAWVPANAAPARATCEGKLAESELRVEIIITAAL